MLFHTLWIGWLVGLVTSFIVKFDEYKNVLSPFDGLEFLGLFLFFSGYALVFTVIAQTGFFAYLFVHRYGQNIFRSFWPTVQVLVILFVLFDIVYFTSKELSLAFRIGLMIVILLVGLIVAWLKVKQTNQKAFIPALFVMIVILTLELSLVLRAGDADFIILMLTPLFAANTYQLLQWYHVTKIDPEHQRRIEERRKRRMEMQKNRQKELEKEKQDNTNKNEELEENTKTKMNKQNKQNNLKQQLNNNTKQQTSNKPSNKKRKKKKSKKNRKKR